jgi:predicted lipid-binding transport protein (Tim44 family)
VKNRDKRILAVSVVCVMVVFAATILLECAAWARAGGGGSMGSRGSRSFSTPSMPSSPSPGSPPSGSGSGMSMPPRQPSTGGTFSRSPFMQGLAGGLAGGMLGSLLFGGIGHASPGGFGGGGIGLLDMLVLGLLVFFLWKFIKRRREASPAAAYHRQDDGGYGAAAYSSTEQPGASYPAAAGGAYGADPYDQIQRGFDQIRQFDPAFNANDLKEMVQDIFFRVQAGWMNRSLDGILDLLTPEMSRYFAGELDGMKQAGKTNRLENIAIRKVEPAEVWQEAGKDFVTVLFTANLLDFTIDDATGQVVEGDRMNPVKFEEFWTFARDIGSSSWQLSAIQQTHEPAQRFH